MVKKTDTYKVKVLEFLALVGELSSDEIKNFTASASYGEKIITTLKRELLIKKSKTGDKDLFRLSPRGKKYLKSLLSEEYENYLSRQRSMNRIRDDKRRIERRDKLVQILLMFHRADIKILPGEKTLLKNNSAITRADGTDNTDAYRPEFYTSMEIKNIIPDYKTGIGSRALGILIANNMLYIVYFTVDGELLWKHDAEKNFLTSTSGTLARRLFGKNYGTYQLVFGDNLKTVAAIMKRCGEKTQGKIYPSFDMPNMLFAIKNTNEDATLDLILHNLDYVAKLKDKYKEEMVPDAKRPFFDGVKKTKFRDDNGIIREREVFCLYAYLFSMTAIVQAIDVSIKQGCDVKIYCFDYQKAYIDAYADAIGVDIGKKTEVITVEYKKNEENQIDE